MRCSEAGIVPYREALSRQQKQLESVAAGGGEEVLLMQHPHVYTAGRRSRGSSLLSARDPDGNPIRLVRVNRGGDLTYHGPGQLVGYPILNLRRRRLGVHLYLRKLERLLIRTLGRFDLAAFARPGLTGVWTSGGKIASIGVGVRCWVTMHGFALNVDPDLRFFEAIHPCGIPGCVMTSIRRCLGREISVQEVVPILRREIVAEFSDRGPGHAPAGRASALREAG